MSARPSAEPADLRVALDIRHPLAYLALRPAIEFGREMAIEVDWLPLEGQPLRAPSPPAADDDRSVRHRRYRAQAIAREISIYARARGLTLREPYRSASPHAAHLAWLWVRAHAPDSLPALLEELFRRYWALDLDAGDRAAVTGVLRALGLPSSDFEGWAADEGAHELERVARVLQEAGVHQAPAYIVEGEVFHGRQHLPMIRWLLEGRTGPRPI
jgi:2-hydroxychromene-2-carboxylate isomerase